MIQLKPLESDRYYPKLWICLECSHEGTGDIVKYCPNCGVSATNIHSENKLLLTETEIQTIDRISKIWANANTIDPSLLPRVRSELDDVQKLVGMIVLRRLYPEIWPDYYAIPDNMIFTGEKKPYKMSISIEEEPNE